MLSILFLNLGFKVFKDEDNGMDVHKLTESMPNVLSAIHVRAGGCK